MQGLKWGFGSFVPTEEWLGWNSVLSGLRGKGQSCLCRNGGWKAQKSPGRVCSGMVRRECVPCFAGTRISRKAWKYSIPFPCPVSCAHQESSGTSTQLQPLLTAGEPSKDKHVLDPALECVFTFHIHWLLFLHIHQEEFGFFWQDSASKGG